VALGREWKGERESREREKRRKTVVVGGYGLARVRLSCVMGHWKGTYLCASSSSV
jgi:hypothetical protein